MASYDQLSAQQRAIVDLILKRGQTYEQLADTLAMPEARVRELASEALTSLAPVSAGAVEESWRAGIADYLLGQQDPAAAATTRGRLRRSEAARAWSRSVLDSLEHLYPKGELPTIPSGDGGGDDEEPPAPAPKPRAPRTAAPLSPAAAAIVRRRRLAGIGAAALALLFVLLIWPVGLVTGGDDGGEQASGPCASGAPSGTVGQVVLEPVRRGAEAAGVAEVSSDGEGCQIRVVAKLPRTRRNQAYELWLYNSPDDARSLGAQVTDRQGNFAGAAPFPADFDRYRTLEITRERVDANRAHSGNVVLRARTNAIRPAEQQPQGDEQSSQGQQQQQGQ